MNFFTRAGAAALLVVAVLIPGAGVAGAESYTNPDTPDLPGTDQPVDHENPGEVLPSDTEQPGNEETSGAPGGVEETDVSPAEAETAPSGTLPFTGGDVLGMTAIGLGAVALGTVLVRRSRRDVEQTA